MARLGRPPALTSTTVVYLPFQDGANILTDRSSGALAVSQVGTGTAPYWAGGPYGDGCAFTSATKHLSMAAITFAGSLTVEAHIRTDDGGNLRTVVCQRDQTGTQLSVFRLAASNSSVAFTVYNAAAASDTITAALPFPSASTRYFHVRAVYDKANLMLLIFVDGWLAAKKSTTIAALPAATLPIIEIGGESSAVLTSVFAGRLANVRILSTAEITTEGLAPGLRASALARRDIATVDLGPLSDLSDNAAWVNDGLGGYYLPLTESTFTLGRFIAQPQDVIAVKAKIGTGTGSTSTTYTEVGNITDLRAGTSVYFVDMANGRLCSSENPSTFDSFEVEIRLPLAGRGEVRGTRYYLGALVSTGDPRRGFAYPGEQFDTGGGGTMTIDGSHAGLPDAWTSEEAGGVIWTGARVFIASRPLGAPWSSRIPTFAGYVDQPPGDSPDVVSLALVTDLGALHLRAAAAGIVDLVTYPNVYGDDEGKELDAPIGYGILGVPAYCIDARPQTIDGVINLFQYRWSSMNCARLRRFGKSPGSALVYHVDLAACTLYSNQSPLAGPYTVDVDGLCLSVPSTATSTGLTTVPFGTLNDLAKTASEIVKGALYNVLALSDADYNSTVITDYATRALAWFRYDEPISSAGSLPQWLAKALYDFLGCLYVEPYTEGQPTRWAIKDVNTAEAVVGTLRDVDIIAESYPKDYGNLAQSLNGKALVYWLDGMGRVNSDASATQALTVDRKYRLHRKPLDLGMRGALTEAQLHDWMDLVSGQHETPRRNLEGSLSRRWLATSQMDAITNASTQLPTGIGTRFRAKAIAPRAGSIVQVAAFPESPFPTDGGQLAPVRDPLGPMIKFRANFGAGQACATGGWTRVGTFRHPMQGAWGAFPATANSVDHTLHVRMKRTGGAADTDFQIRLVTAAGAVIATIATGVGTAADHVSTTTFTTANIPATDAELELQTLGSAGASGTVYDAVWYAVENTAVGFQDSFASTLMFGYGTQAGISLATQIGTLPPIWLNSHAVAGYIKHPSGGAISYFDDETGGLLTESRCVIRADGTGSTGLRIGLHSWSELYNTAGPWDFAPLATSSVAIAGGDAFYEINPLVRFGGPWILLVYADVIGSAVLYSISTECRAILPVR